MNEEIKLPKTPGSLINDCLFWIEGLADDTCQTSYQVLAMFDKAIESLQKARLMYLSNLDDE